MNEASFFLLCGFLLSGASGSSKGSACARISAGATALTAARRRTEPPDLVCVRKQLRSPGESCGALCSTAIRTTPRARHFALLHACLRSGPGPAVLHRQPSHRARHSRRHSHGAVGREKPCPAREPRGTERLEWASRSRGGPERTRGRPYPLLVRPTFKRHTDVDLLRATKAPSSFPPMYR